MSRYNFTGPDGEHVTVGWDNPLQTYFVDLGDENEPYFSSMIGEGHFDVTRVTDLENMIGFSIPEEIKLQLEIDQANATEPTSLQKRMSVLFNKALDEQKQKLVDSGELDEYYYCNECSNEFHECRCLT